ncbi:MAG: hypothetical protein CVV30_04895 [Methanomicrobiales archaeon HGW-Methanomicrobiales-1]|jgi:hypothetical protein|nr:MAG: hypothetical protein CVV30_04895 [Methanomicrobiales archaeon HGW-Methanomicrobiales-1]
MKKKFVSVIIASSIVAGLIVCFLLGAGCTDSASASGKHWENLSNSSSLFVNNDPNTVPVGTAYNQTLLTFWRFTLDGPYAANPNWNTASLDPTPVILYDINGQPQYYEFYVRNNRGIPGYFWTAANKLMGHGIFRIYEGAPSYNHSLIAQDAEAIVKARYPDYPLLSNVPALYGGGYPMLSSRIMIRNTSSGVSERIIVDAFTHEIVPDHASEDYKGHEYAWSYLDSIPESEYPARIAQWELQESNASRIVDYAMAQGIDIRLPLSEENASIIRNYYAGESPGESADGSPAQETDGSPEKIDIRPVTDELIRENVVPVETARTRAQSVLWDRQVDRPEIYEDLSYRDATLGSRDPVAIEDFAGHKLSYVFSVERSGRAIGEIIVAANKGLFSHPWGLDSSAGSYDLVNATRVAQETALRDFPGETVLTVRPVYSLADNCCHNVTVMMEVENQETRRINRILVDTYTLNTRSETVTRTGETDAYPSLFSKVTPEDFAENVERWNTENNKDRDFISFAKSQEIPVDRPLTNKEIVALGTYIANNTPVYGNPPALFNPLYPGPEVRPTLNKEALVWREQADWFTYIDVDASLSDRDIIQIISSHRIPCQYTVQIWPASIARDFYFSVAEADYNRTFLILAGDTSVTIPERVNSRGEYIEIPKRENGMITIPVRIGAPKEANFLHLTKLGVHLKPMKTVSINIDPVMNKTEQEKILAEFNDDDRVLFARKEYPG